MPSPILKEKPMKNPPCTPTRHALTGRVNFDIGNDLETEKSVRVIFKNLKAKLRAPPLVAPAEFIQCAAISAIGMAPVTATQEVSSERKRKR